jgi:hypothetical protein
LSKAKVYINLAKFKSATLVVCGFFVGAHPGRLRQEDAEVEIRTRLQLPEDFPFQLSSRTITVQKDSGKEAEKYSFPTVAVETSTRQAKRLREAFFAQLKPADAKHMFPYTGPYQFVPLLPSKEWSVHKIFQLAKVHVRICDNLKAIYIQNLQDIRNEIGPQGNTLLKGILGMTLNLENKEVVPLIQSVHNTGRATVKVVLVLSENYDFALEQLAVLHPALLAGVPEAYQSNVFVDNLEVGLMSGHRNTIHSCNSSHHAKELLQLYNPQDAEEESTPSTVKRFRPTVFSYAAAAASTNVTTALSNSSPAQTQQFTSITSLTDQDLDQLYERLKHHVEVVDDDSPGISTEEMEKMVQESNNTILQAREEMCKSVAELTAQVDNINTAVRKQNVVIVAL